MLNQLIRYVNSSSMLNEVPLGLVSYPDHLVRKGRVLGWAREKSVCYTALLPGMTGLHPRRTGREGWREDSCGQKRSRDLEHQPKSKQSNVHMYMTHNYTDNSTNKNIPLVELK